LLPFDAGLVHSCTEFGVEQMGVLMRSWINRKFGLFAVLLASGIAACSESPTSIADPQSTLIPLPLPLPLPGGGDDEESGPTPLRCPTDDFKVNVDLITPLGGVVRAAGSAIRLPEGSLLEPTIIAMIVPASRFMEIDIRANWLEHFVFQKPVRVVIDYSRCPNWRLNQGPLSVWYWNPVTRELIENMNAEDHRDKKRIVFWTTHLSGYVIAN
jgi:hypothetical protein